MPFTIVRNDITRMAVDAIVNSAAPHLLGGGGADGEIHRVAGPELMEACRGLGGCKPGEAKLTEGYHLPCRYVIHTVGPVWMGGLFHEEETLRLCYRNALQLAHEQGLETIAFPLISSGIFAYPREKALRIATEEIGNFVLKTDLMVYLVVYDQESFRISSRLQQDIQQFIDDSYVAEHSDAWPEDECDLAEPFQAGESNTGRFTAVRPFHQPMWDREAHSTSREMAAWEADVSASPEESWDMADACCTAPVEMPCIPDGAVQGIPHEAVDHEAILRDLLNHQQDESFTQRLLRLIDESGMTDPECYRRANIDRRLFSKIRKNLHYQPSKQTALAFAVALRLDRAAAEQLLQTAGLALSRSSKFDLVVAYFINEGIYDVMQINEALYAFDLPLLGN